MIKWYGTIGLDKQHKSLNNMNESVTCKQEKKKKRIQLSQFGDFDCSFPAKWSILSLFGAMVISSKNPACNYKCLDIVQMHLYIDKGIKQKENYLCSVFNLLTISALMAKWRSWSMENHPTNLHQSISGENLTQFDQLLLL